MENDSGAAAPEPLLDVDGLAAWLRTTPAWVYTQVEAGRVPVVRLGRKLRFDREEIGQWLDERRSAGIS
jgi:excisionase family DNA binding protein